MEDAHVAIVLEDLRSQFKVFGEALEATRESLERQIAGVAEDLERKIAGVARALERQIVGVAVDVADMKVRLARVEVRLNGLPVPRPKRKR